MIDASHLAQLMLKWERLRYELDEVEAEIKAMVLEIGKTQTVGNVRASYSGGRKRYNYEAAGIYAPPDVINRHTKPATDWRSVCRDAKISDIPFTQSKPSVRVKIL